MAHSGRVFTLTVGNLPTQTFAVVEFTLNEALSTLFSLEASLTSADPDIDFADVLDNDATLCANISRSYCPIRPSRCFSGFMTHAISGIFSAC